MNMVLFIILFFGISNAQVKDVKTKFTSVWGADYRTNLVKNPSALENSKYKTTSNATADRDTSAGYTVDYASSWAIQTSALNGYVEFDLNAPPEDLKSGKCKFTGVYKGDASLYEAQITDGSGNRLNGIALTNSSSSFSFFTVPFSCASTNKIRIKQVVVGTAPLINAGQLFYGRGEDFLSAAIRTQEVSYTATLTNLGTGASQSLKWYQDGAFIYIRGNITCGSSVPASVASVSFPSTFTSSSNISTIEQFGTYFHGGATATASHGGGILVEPSATVFYFTQASTFNSTSINTLDKSTGANACLASNIISINAKIPIAGASNLTAVPASLTNTPRTQYTPTFTGFGTVTTHECFKSTEGEFGYIDCKFTSGTSTAVEGRVSLPSEWTVPTWSQGIRAVGTVGALSATGAVPVIQLESGSTYVTFGFQGGSNAGQSKLNGSSMLNSGQSITFTAKIPLANKVPNGGATIGAGAIFSNSSTNQFRYEDAFVSGGNPPTILNPTTSGWLVFSTRTAAGDYTFTHSFGVQPKCGITPIAATRRFARFQTLNSTTIRVTIEDSAGAGTDTDFTIWCTVAR